MIPERVSKIVSATSKYVTKAKNDVQPFIKDIGECELWSKEFFISVVENMKVCRLNMIECSKFQNKA